MVEGENNIVSWGLYDMQFKIALLVAIFGCVRRGFEYPLSTVKYFLYHIIDKKKTPLENHVKALSV